MSTESLKNSVRSYLAFQHMNVDDEWLTGCIEYLTEDSSNGYSESDIKNLAKEQWLLNDLKDICPGSLPANLKSKHRITLTDRFALQINAALDIGSPAYQQYLKLQKVNTENIEATTKSDDKVPSHRMIKLILTDGVQEISGIEYKPMRNLSCDITPGCKALVKGPVECRRGVLLLTESNLELLGGEVQEIALSNSLAGLLSSKLGLPITQESAHNTTINQRRNSDIPTPHTDMPSANPHDNYFEQSRPNCARHNENIRTNNENIRTNNENTRTNNENIRTNNENTRAFENTRPVARVAGIPIPSTSFADDDIDIDQLAAIEAQIDTRTKRPATDFASKPDKKIKMDTINQIDDYPTEDDLFIEDDEYLREMEAKFDAKERSEQSVTVSAEPFVYIKQINDLSARDKAGRVFKVKAQIMKLLSKLSVGKDGWSLKCTLVDGTGTIDVDFTSCVLSKLVGFTPQEMNQLKKQMASKPELKEKAVSALQKAKDTLQVLYCIIELTILESPKITNLIPFEESHVHSLKKRIQGTCL